MKAALVALSGSVLIIGGVAMWSVPAAIVTAGVLLLLAGVFADLDRLG